MHHFITALVILLFANAFTKNILYTPSSQDLATAIACWLASATKPFQLIQNKATCLIFI